ncbi:Flp1 family type IVb pilin [Oribacterium sp. C9]|uniref:Flp1 family type IVb pilin n=1 Tax=Oribacterium sp. C9 TaxID=1943579 RepID=UPI0026A32F3C|nr:Flp1 family type IVb pilin [Oribacterium sp. C9]
MNTTTTAAILTMPGLPSRPDNDLEEQINKVYEKCRYGLFYYGMKFKNAVKNHIHYLFHGESGIGTIEMVLILVVLIALVIVFKGRINALLTDIFDQIDSSAQSVY